MNNDRTCILTLNKTVHELHRHETNKQKKNKKKKQQQHKMLQNWYLNQACILNIIF